MRNARPSMLHISDEKFYRLVAEGIDAIDDVFLDVMENVAVIIEDEPNEEKKKELGLGDNETLFGLYEGVPLAVRGVEYGGVLPDKITIFKYPICEVARSEEEVRTIVCDTVWHEIAHHFGMEEDEVRKAEDKRRNLFS